MYIEPLKQQNIISDMDAQALFNNWQIIVSVLWLQLMGR